MCGGIREMESRLSPRLHEEMKPYMPHAAAADISCRHRPAPAGLAIVAALLQSGVTTSPNKAAESAHSSTSSPANKAAPSCTSSLPIPISPSSSSSAYDQKINKQRDHMTIFSTSLSPPCSLYTDLYDDFLGVCLSCKRPLGPGKDIYMYRGDRAFCSTECRHKHIIADESILCNIQINQQCIQASSPTNEPKLTPPFAIAILV